MAVRHIRLLLLLLCCLCASLLISMVTPRHVHALAPADSITVTALKDSVHFPGSIDFSMTANDSSGLIKKAALYLTIGDNLETHLPTINKPAASLSIAWHEVITGDNFSPPGTQASYSWQVWDSAGTTYTTATQDFTITDTRFNWQHLSQGRLQVDWYNRDQNFGQIMLNQASASINHISSVLGRGLLDPINLWVYQTDQDFHGSLAPGSYEWVGGVALPSLNEASIVVVGSSDTTLIRDMPHELTHLVFHQLIAQGIFAPTWFDEGLAVYNQTYHEPEMEQVFDNAIAENGLLRLSEIWHGFPANADKAYLAYAESWKLVDYMYSTFGQTRMAQLIRDMNNPATDLDQDLRQALGEDQLHLENQWRLHYNQPSVLPTDQVTPTSSPSHLTNPLQATDNSTLVLVGIGFVLIAGSLGIMLLLVVNLRRRNKALTVGTVNRTPSGYSQPGYPYQSARYQQQAYSPTNRQPGQEVWGTSHPPIGYGQPGQEVWGTSHPQARYTQPGYPPHAPQPGQEVWGTSDPQGVGSSPNFLPPPTTKQSSDNEPAEQVWGGAQMPRAERGEYWGNGVTEPPYMPGQEYLSQHPEKQAPQE